MRASVLSPGVSAGWQRHWTIADIHIGSLGQRRLCIGGCGVFGLGHELCLLAWLVRSRRSLLGLLPVSRVGRNGVFWSKWTPGHRTVDSGLTTLVLPSLSWSVMDGESPSFGGCSASALVWRTQTGGWLQLAICLHECMRCEGGGNWCPESRMRHTVSRHRHTLAC